LQLNIDANISISCYSLEIKRVVHELIQNSIQAIQTTGVISITSKVRSTDLDLTFKDNGIGVPQEIRQKLFEPFVSSRISGEGIGLGLYISQKIIEIHKGIIIYYSEESFTVFQISLPL